MSQISQLLQAALNANSNGVLITDNTLEDNASIYANPGFERLASNDIHAVNESFHRLFHTSPEHTIINQLVERHGGSVEGQSDGKGKGSTFQVSIPLDANQGEGQTSQQKEAGRDRRRTILVVDDNEDAAEMVALTLGLWGYRVLVAHGGEKAVQMALSARPQVALLDIGLPDLDGYQVAHKIREKCPSSMMKLIALTGYAQESDVQKALDNGFDAHLAKPIAFATLREYLRAYESEL